MSQNSHEAWKHFIERVCRSKGLSYEDAEDCVSEVLLRYARRHSAFPWEEQSPDSWLLQQIAHDVACEYLRILSRRRKLQEAYESTYSTFQTTQLKPEDIAVSEADIERFHKSLPSYLFRTLDLLLKDYAPSEIARLLNVSVGTVYTYRAELKRRFIEYFGYDPRNSRGSVGNFKWERGKRFPNSSEEVYDARPDDGWQKDRTDNNRSDTNDHIAAHNTRKLGGGVVPPQKQLR